MLTIIFIIFIVITLGIIVFILFRHLKHLTAIDLKNLPQEKTANIKTGLIENRLRRKLNAFTNVTAQKYIAPVLNKVGTKIKNTYVKALNLEKYYKREKHKKLIVNLDVEEKNNLIKNKLNLAQEYFLQANNTAAEEIYIDVVAMDPKNIEAFLGLAKIYFSINDLPHAKEIYQHILKINTDNDKALAGLAELAIKENDWQSAKEVYEKIIKLKNDDPEYYCDYGLVLEKMGELGSSLEAYQKALTLKPNDPRYLDYLLEASIINKKKYLAYKVLDRLKEANPENNKLDEFKRRIEEL